MESEPTTDPSPEGGFTDTPHDSQQPVAPRRQVWLLSFAAIFVYKYWALKVPASWDASWTTLAGAVTLRSNGFNIVELASLAPWYENGPATYALSPVTWYSGLLLWLTPAGFSTLTVLHVGHFAIGAAAFTGLYRYIRPNHSARETVGILMGVALLPVVSAQLGFMYLEIPLLATAVAAMNAATRRRWIQAALWATLAAAIKPSGVVVGFALAAVYLDTQGWRFSREWFRSAGFVLAPIAAIAVGLMAVPYGAPPGSELGPSSLTQLKLVAFGVPDVALLIAIGLLGALLPSFKARKHLGFRFGNWLIIAFFSMFVLLPVLGLGERLGPRYLTLLAPFALHNAYLVVRHFSPGSPATAIAVLFLVFSFANRNGTMYPGPDVAITALQERSNGYADLLASHELALHSAIEDHEGVLIVPAGFWFRATYPDLGYVNEPADVVPTNRIDWENEDSLPDVFTLLVVEFDFTDAELAVVRNSSSWTSTSRVIDHERFPWEIWTVRRIK